MKKQIRIGVGDAATTAKGFIDAWKNAEQGEEMRAEHRLYFENLETLLKTLTQGRWVLLKTLRTKGPMSIRALAKELGRLQKRLYGCTATGANGPCGPYQRRECGGAVGYG